MFVNHYQWILLNVVVGSLSVILERLTRQFQFVLDVLSEVNHDRREASLLFIIHQVAVLSVPQSIFIKVTSLQGSAVLP
jgi:hypothetical protein